MCCLFCIILSSLQFFSTVDDPTRILVARAFLACECIFRAVDSSSLSRESRAQLNVRARARAVAIGLSIACDTLSHEPCLTADACRMYRVLLFLISIYGSIHGSAVSHFPNKGDVPRQYHPRFLMYEEPHNIEFKYHNYEQMSRFLRATSLRYQNLTALYSIGKSVKGTSMCVIPRDLVGDRTEGSRDEIQRRGMASIETDVSRSKREKLTSLRDVVSSSLFCNSLNDSLVTLSSRRYMAGKVRNNKPVTSSGSYRIDRSR